MLGINAHKSRNFERSAQKRRDGKLHFAQKNTPAPMQPSGAGGVVQRVNSLPVRPSRFSIPSRAAMSAFRADCIDISKSISCLSNTDGTCTGNSVQTCRGSSKNGGFISENDCQGWKSDSNWFCRNAIYSSHTEPIRLSETGIYTSASQRISVLDLLCSERCYNCVGTLGQYKTGW